MGRGESEVKILRRTLSYIDNIEIKAQDVVLGCVEG
jgi:hypothetical protein